MIDDDFDLRCTNRIVKLNDINDDYDDNEFLSSLSQKKIICIQYDGEISETLDLLLNENENIRFSSLFPLSKFSKNFPRNFLEQLTQKHFYILYNLLQNEKSMYLVLKIFSNLSRKDEFNPPPDIFKIIQAILLNKNSDEKKIAKSLVLSKNLIKLNQAYYSIALQLNIHQTIIQNDVTDLQIIILKISVLSSFLKYQNHETEKYILNYLMQDGFILQNNAEIYREILNGFEYAMCWSDIAIQIINNSNLIPISENLLASGDNRNIQSALSFLKKCIIELKINNVQFVKSFVILMTEDEDDYIFEDIIASFIYLISTRSSYRNFLFNCISQIGLNRLLYMKSYPIKKVFLSFLSQSSKICPNDVMVISFNDLGLFLQEMIQTDESDLQFLSLDIICALITSPKSEWVESFSKTLVSLNILDTIYQSSLLDNNLDVVDVVDLVSSYLSKFEN